MLDSKFRLKYAFPSSIYENVCGVYIHEEILPTTHNYVYHLYNFHESVSYCSIYLSNFNSIKATLTRNFDVKMHFS